MRIEQRIRSTASEKVKVKITNRSRSKLGFIAWYPVRDEHGLLVHGLSICRNRQEALQTLLAKMRCFSAIEFGVAARKTKEEGQ